MARLSMVLPLIAALAAAPAAAQDDGDTTKVEPVLDTGSRVVQSDVAPDGTYVRETSGDWQVKCLKDPAGAERCQLYQLLLDANGNSVAEANIFRLKDSGQVMAGATIVVPLETLLTEGLTLSVDNGNAKRYNFSFCTPIGCFARLGFTEADVDAFKRGATGTILIVPALAPNQPVAVSMSLAGFTKGFDLITPIEGPKQ